MKKRKKMEPWPLVFHKEEDVAQDRECAVIFLKRMKTYRIMAGAFKENTRPAALFVQAATEYHLERAYHAQVRMIRHLMELGFDLVSIASVASGFRKYIADSIKSRSGGREKIRQFLRVGLPMEGTEYGVEDSSFEKNLRNFILDCRKTTPTCSHRIIPKDVMKQVHVEMVDYLYECGEHLMFLEDRTSQDACKDVHFDTVREEDDTVMKRLQDNAEKLYRLYHRVASKATNAIDHINMGDEELDGRKMDTFLGILSMTWTKKVIREIYEKTTPDNSWLETDLEDNPEMEEPILHGKIDCLTSGLFWYSILTGLIDSHEIGVDRDCLELILKCQQSPKVVKKTKCSQALQKFKSGLGKRIAPLFAGQAAAPLFTVDDLLALDPREAMRMVADHFAESLYASEQYAGLWNDPGRHKKVLSLWDDLVLPSADSILLRYCMDLKNPCYAERSLSDLEDELLASMLAEDEAAWLQENLPQADQSEDSMLEQVVNRSDQATWVIVSDAWAENPDTRKIAPENRLAELEQALRDFKNTAVVKPSSIMSAVEYFTVAVEVDPLSLDKVSVGDKRWYKMKRGRCRILCRKEEDTVLFHVYPRKEWKHGMFE